MLQLQIVFRCFVSLCCVFFSSCAFAKSAESLRELSVFSKAADRFLRVGRCRQTMHLPRGGQTFSTEPLKNPPVSGDLGGADTAITADRERQETVFENLGIRDTSRVAVGEFLPLTNRVEAAIMRRTKDMERCCHFPASQHKVFQMHNRI